jgi:ribosome recycling factor
MYAVEKAIIASPLGLNPSNDGRLVRVPIPALSEERRKDLMKVARKYAEEAKVSVRNIRRHYVDAIKDAQKKGEIPEDDAHHMTDEIQKATDKHSVRIDEALALKEKDIMEV